MKIARVTVRKVTPTEERKLNKAHRHLEKQRKPPKPMTPSQRAAVQDVNHWICARRHAEVMGMNFVTLPHG